jgi:hypothetical protein
MRKMTFIVSLFVSLMLTPLAMAQGWKSNEVTNRTTRNVYLVFSTWRPATQSLPEGYRITGHYRLMPNQTHEFYALNNNAFYLQVWHPNLKVIKPTADTRTFSAPVIGDSFEMVLQRQISFAFRTNTILYRQPSGNYPLEDGFLRYGNTGTPINITSAWVNIDTPTIPEEPETTHRPPDDDTTPSPHPPDEAGEVVLEDDIEIPTTPETPATPDVNIAMRTNSGSTTLNQGSTTQLTISVTENGDPAAGRTLSLSVQGDKATISPTLGTTNSNGQLSATLGINRSATTGTFNVTAEISNTSYSTSLPITIQVGAGQISVSASPSTVEPKHKAKVTITVRTPGGNPFPGAEISLSTAFGNIQPTLVTTNAQGQATATWTAPPYTGTPHPGEIATNTITATVVADKTVTGTTRIPMKYIPGSFSVGGAYRSITSGKSATVTVTVTSKTGRVALSGVTVRFVESNSRIAFSSRTRTTNSSGRASTTLRTGGKGSASFRVEVPGLSSKTFTAQVEPIIKTTTEYISDEGRRVGLFDRNQTDTRTKRVDFPGRVVSSTWRSESSHATVTRSESGVPYSDEVRITYKITAKSFPLAWIRVWVTAKYEWVASSPGAPSLQQPQLRPETGQLSAVWHDLSEIPSETALLPNYPNPFNPETWIPYHLAESADVTLSIYSADGKLVRTLALGHQPAGIYENKSRAAYWDGRNAVGERVASGLYFYTLTAGNFAATGKMLIMK